MTEQTEQDAFAELEKDITADIVVGSVENADTDGVDIRDIEDSAIPQEDHPALALLDIAVSESVNYCKVERLPPPNLALWEKFSRSMLNRSLWHYFPDGDLPDSPAVCMLLGVGGLAICYVPVALAVYRREAEKGERGKADKAEKKERIRPAEKAEEPRGDVAKVAPGLAEKLKNMELAAEAI